MAQMGAVPPEKSLSYAEANYNGKDEPELERPGTSKGKVSHSHINYCTGDTSHDRKHEKEIDGGKENSHNTTWDVVLGNKGRNSASQA